MSNGDELFDFINVSLTLGSRTIIKKCMLPTKAYVKLFSCINVSQAFDSMIPFIFSSDRFLRDVICANSALFCLGSYLLITSVVFALGRYLTTMMYHMQQNDAGIIHVVHTDLLPSTILFKTMNSHFEYCSTVTPSPVLHRSSSAAFVRTD